jgi:hypothetical protein
MSRVAVLAVALVVGACGFPAAFVCGPEAPCAQGAECDEASGRCVGARDAEQTTTDASHSDASGDMSASHPDAVMSDGGLNALCHRLCPAAGPCEALVTVGDPSFEIGDDHWVFQAPAGRVTTAEDFGRPFDGEWMAEMRLDAELETRRTFVRLEQALDTAELPPGRYRVCFRRRVVASAGDACPGFPGAEHSLVLTGRDPSPDAVEPVVMRLWEQTNAAWCAETSVDKGIRRSPWHETCVDHQMDAPWVDPGLLFITRVTGFLTSDHFHTLLLDDVRLHAVDCMTWR